MARAYGDDLRRKLLEAHAAGEGTLPELARRFRVSVAWAWKVSAAFRQTGAMTRTPQRRAASRVPLDRLRQMVRAEPDMVLREMAETLRTEGHPISQPHLWRVLRKMGVRLKKSHSTPPSATPKPTSSGATSSSRRSGKPRPKT